MKLNFIITLVLVLALSAAAYALPIADPDNPHNMSNQASHGGPKAAATLAGGTDRICVFCHTPHSAAPKSPLWGRPDPDLMGTFPLYADATLAIKTDTAKTGYVAGADYPSGASRMCLSCHDGATSIGVLLVGTPITMEGGSETITKVSAVIDLSTSHPISFNYNNDVVTTVLNSTDYQLPLGLIEVPLDGSGQMQCTTCHDPHEDTRGDAAYGNLPFWRHQGNLTSYDDVCNDCHIAAPISGSLPHTLP